MSDISLNSTQHMLLTECESRIGYRFRNKQILYEALTHASVAGTRLQSNERLEFLGDAILGFTVCELLYQLYPAWMEGELTRIKSAVVSRVTCARLSEQMGLQECLVLGKGVASGGNVPRSLLANVFESIIAAIYVDGGLAAAQDFLRPLLIPEIEMAAGDQHELNYKSELQHISQRRYGTPPIYRLLDEKGPDHNKWFLVAANLGNRTFSPAWGSSKKEAEQRAAANALAELDEGPPPFPELD